MADDGDADGGGGVGQRLQNVMGSVQQAHTRACEHTRTRQFIIIDGEFRNISDKNRHDRPLSGTHTHDGRTWNPLKRCLSKVNCP